MFKQNHWRTFGLGGLAVACAAAATPALALDAVQELRIVTVKGEKLTQLTGKPFDGYTVMASSNGQLQPIPFQFDEMNERGFPYVPGGSIPVDGQENVFEAQDMLVFMFKDAGEQVSADALGSAGGTAVAEVAVTERGETRYIYVVEGSSQRSDKRYVNYDNSTGRLKTDYYTLNMEPNKPLIWEDLTYKGANGGKTVLDAMKIRIDPDLFMAPTITNNVLPHSVAAVKNGPVRSLIAVDASLNLVVVKISAGATVAAGPQTVEVPVYASIPGITPDLNIDISLDFHELEGTKIVTAEGPQQPVVAGTKSGPDPAKLGASAANSWIVGSSGKGFDVAAFFVGAEAYNPTLDILYYDAARGDDAVGPERYKGSHPEVGYRVSDIPKGQDITIGVNLFFSDDLWGMGPQQVAGMIQAQPSISVSPM